MKYVYVLADYDEGGLEATVATLDLDSLPGLLEEFTQGYPEDHRTEATTRLTPLCQPDGKTVLLGKYNLMSGWGGVQLYVIQLNESGAGCDLCGAHIPL